MARESQALKSARGGRAGVSLREEHQGPEAYSRCSIDGDPYMLTPRIVIGNSHGKLLQLLPNVWLLHPEVLGCTADAG